MLLRSGTRVSRFLLFAKVEFTVSRHRTRNRNIVRMHVVGYLLQIHTPGRCTHGQSKKKRRRKMKKKTTVYYCCSCIRDSDKIRPVIAASKQ